MYYQYSKSKVSVLLSSLVKSYLNSVSLLISLVVIDKATAIDIDDAIVFYW